MKIFLIGDSIRLSSEPFVRAGLSGGSEVVSPSVNCESSRSVAAHIREWAPASPSDIVHLNCGLHDIRHDPGLDHPLCSSEEYVNNLREVFAYLLTTGAKVVWATSTPINEQAHNSAKLSRRYERELSQYNRLSISVAKEFGFSVNDLYFKLSAEDLTTFLLPDGVHFNQSGNALVGRLISEAIQHEGGA